MMKNNLSMYMGRDRISAVQLHKETGISITTIYSLKNEKLENPNFAVIRKLCDYFDCTFNEFFKLEKVK